MVSRFSFLLFFVFCSLNAQQTYVPDDGFEQYLIYFGLDDVLDNYVLTNNINNRQNLTLNAGWYDIEDLTGIEDFVNLRTLKLEYLSIEEIDLSNNHLLESLEITAENITQIDLSVLPNLKQVKLGINVSEIDFSNNPLLEDVEIYAGLAQIDFSQNPNLKKVIIYNAQLSNLDFSNNPLLKDVEIRAPIAQIDFSQNPNLKKVIIYNAQLSDLDFSNNPSLQIIELWYSAITHININQNINLKEFRIFGGQLSEIDFSNNNLLEIIYLSDVPLNQINLSQNSKLKDFRLFDSLITEIDLSNNPSVESIYSFGNPLTDINLSNNPNLKVLDIRGSELFTVDTSNLPLLEKITVKYGPVQYLDLSNNPNLVWIVIYDIDGLDYLNIQNGNNTNITHFRSTSNNTLYCIQVDDPIWSEENWNIVDDHTSFESYCEFILNTNDIKSAEKIKFYPNPVKNTITIENPDLTIDKINLIDVNGKTIFTKSLNTNPIKLNLKSYQKGIYFLQLLSGEKIIQTEKIIKK